MIHTSPLPEVEIPDVHLTSYVLRHAERLADEVAVIEGMTGRAVTYGELADLIRRFAGGLVARGFQPGDRRESCFGCLLLPSYGLFTQ